MIIAVDKHKNQIEMIKKEKNKLSKMKQMGALILDLGNNSISLVAKICECCWRYAKKCLKFVLTGETLESKNETRGRKKITEKHPTLEATIEQIIRDNLSIDPRFRSEKQYVHLTIKEIKSQLINTENYNEDDFCNSTLNNIVNKMGYNLKKVKKVKPLKKVEETDAIFDNVHKKKE